MDFNGVLFPIAKPRVTMPFRATETKWYSADKPHRGVDIAPFPGSYGEPVFAPTHSHVIEIGDHPYAGLELVLELKVPYPFGATRLGFTVNTNPAKRPFWLRMTHHAELLVEKGSKVEAGQVIARIGSTGKYTTGPHVHMELHLGDDYPGQVHDPLDFFVAAIPGLAGALVSPW